MRALQRRAAGAPAESAVTGGPSRDDSAALPVARKPPLARSNSSPCLSPSGPPSLLAKEAAEARRTRANAAAGRAKRWERRAAL